MKKTKPVPTIQSAGISENDALINARLSTEFALIDAGIIMSDANTLIASLMTSYKKQTKTEVFVTLNALSELIYEAQLALAKGNEHSLWQTHEYPADDDLC